MLVDSKVVRWLDDSAGEYIAVEKLETDYSETKTVEQLWCAFLRES